MFNNHSYSGFINFIYDCDLHDVAHIKDDAVNQSLNSKLSGLYFSGKVSQVINDVLFNSNVVYSFSHLVGEAYKHITNVICDKVSTYKYCLSSNKISSYIMDSNLFFVSNNYQGDRIGTVKSTEIYQAKLDDYDDSRILLFNKSLNFSYNVVRKGANTYLYYRFDVDEFSNDSEVMYYIVDDRGDKIKARW